MADSVISCKKIKGNTPKTTTADFIIKSGLPTSEITKNGQKNGSLNRDLLKNFPIYGIFYMLPGEFSCPNGSKHVWQRGVESLQGRVMAAQS